MIERYWTVELDAEAYERLVKLLEFVELDPHTHHEKHGSPCNPCTASKVLEALRRAEIHTL